MTVRIYLTWSGREDLSVDLHEHVMKSEECIAHLRGLMENGWSIARGQVVKDGEA